VHVCVDTAGWFCVFARLRPWRCLWTGQGITLIRHLPVARGQSCCVCVCECALQSMHCERFFMSMLEVCCFFMDKNKCICVCYFCNECIRLHVFYFKRLTQSSIHTCTVTFKLHDMHCMSARQHTCPHRRDCRVRSVMSDSQRSHMKLCV